MCFENNKDILPYFRGDGNKDLRKRGVYTAVGLAENTGKWRFGKMPGVYSVRQSKYNNSDCAP